MRYSIDTVSIDTIVIIQYDTHMSEYIPDPVKNFTPRQNPPKIPGGGIKPKFIRDLTDNELRKIAREKLSEAIQTVDAVEQPELTRRLCAELMDRLDGKPGQAITVDQTLRQIVVNANIEFIPARSEKVLHGGVDKVQVIDNEWDIISIIYIIRWCGAAMYVYQ